MITRNEILETNSMISDMNLDVRTITMGISLLDCADADINKFNEKVYKKITTYAKDLVKVGDELAKEYGVPVVNKRISVTPIAIAAAGCKNADSYVSIAQTLDRAAQEVGVNFIGGKSAPLTSSSARFTTPGPLTPTLIQRSASPTPWNAPAIKGLSSTALQNTTSFAQPIHSLSFVRSAVSTIISPIFFTASMFSPFLEVPIFTEAQTLSVTASASGMESIKILSLSV